jgi:hypothetical protein
MHLRVPCCDDENDQGYANTSESDWLVRWIGLPHSSRYVRSTETKLRKCSSCQYLHSFRSRPTGRPTRHTWFQFDLAIHFQSFRNSFCQCRCSFTSVPSAHRTRGQNYEWALSRSYSPVPNAVVRHGLDNW